MKILAIGDTHCRVSYQEEFEAMVDSVLAVVKREKPDLIVMLGDDLHDHGRAHTVAYNSLMEFIEKLSEQAKVVKLIGNHEVANPNVPDTLTTFFKFMPPNVTVVEGFTVIDYVDGVRIAAIPFMADKDFARVIKEGRDILSTVDYVFAHQELKGSVYNSSISDVDSYWDNDLPIIICGHIHQKQSIRNGYYVGTPYQTGFNEGEDKSVVILEKGQPLRELCLNNLIKYRTVEIEASRKTLPALEIGVKYRFKVKGTVDEMLKFKRSKIYETLQEAKVKIVPIVEVGSIPHFDKDDRQTFMQFMDSSLPEDLRPIWKEVKKCL